MSGPNTSLIANQPYPYHFQRVSISSIPDNIAQPSLHHRTRWCKPKTTMHHVIKHSTTNSVEHRNNESPEGSYVDPAKGGPRTELPVKSSGGPLARRTGTSLFVTKKKTKSDVNAPLALTARHPGSADSLVGWPFITVGQLHVVNPIWQGASGSQHPRGGRCCPHDGCNKHKAVMEDSLHDFFGANPPSRARK